ncbi:MAG: hypothetical protein J7M14_03795 [Planctomycetes bacterium]|nr:hypothetical protein [Planctomycetota bacterium]
MSGITTKAVYEWCRIPVDQLLDRTDLRVPLRIVADSAEMGLLMARELVELIEANNSAGKATRAIIPCGPSCWYKSWCELVNDRGVSLENFFVFHMDECLDWQGRTIPPDHPYNFRGFMEKHFYGPIRAELNVPESQRFWPAPEAIGSILEAIDRAPIDITYGGWGQDGHVAYNQARRHPLSHVTLDDLRNSTMRIQDNNLDTIVALAQRTFGSAYQFVPPMSITLGMRECLSAARIRVFSDTGAWKQTALRVALFSDPTPEYPITLLQEHDDALITATRDTARHPISEHDEWDLGL